MATGREVLFKLRAKDETRAAIESAKKNLGQLSETESRLAKGRDIRANLAQQKALTAEWKRATDAARNYGRQIKAATAANANAGDIRRLEAQRKAQVNAAVTARAVLEEQRASLERLRGSMRGSFADFARATRTDKERAAAAREVARAAEGAAIIQVREARRIADSQGRAAVQAIRAQHQMQAEMARTATQAKATGAAMASSTGQSRGLRGGGFAAREPEALASRTGRGFLGLRPYEVTNLSFQINDIVTGLATGQKPAQVFAQQIGQIAQLFPQVIKGAIGLKGPLAAIAVVLTPIVTAFARLQTEANSLDLFRTKLRASADGADFSAAALARLATELDLTGGSIDHARDSINTFIEAGIKEDRLRQFSTTARDMAKVLGTEMPEAAGQLATAFAGGLDAVIELDGELNVFTAAQLRSARTMAAQGQETEALNMLLGVMQAKYAELAADMDGPWSRAAGNLADAWASFITWLANTSVVHDMVAALELLGTIAETVTGALASVMEWITSISGALPGFMGKLAKAASFAARLVTNPIGAAASLAGFGADAPTAAPGDNPTGAITDPTSEKNTKAADQAQAEADAEFAEDLMGDLQDSLKKSDEARAEARQQAIQDQNELNDSIAETVAQNEFDLSLVGKGNTEKAVAVALREAEADAAAKGLVLTDAQRASVEATTRSLSDAEEAEKARLAAMKGGGAAKKEENAQTERQRVLEKEVNDLLSYRRELMDSIEFFDEQGEGATADALREKLTGVNDDLLVATQNMIDFWKAVGGPEAEAAILKLQRTHAEIAIIGQNSVTSGKEINDFIANGGAAAFDALSKSVVETGNVFQAARDAFLQFASDFLREIAQMIIKQAILNALGAGTSGGGGGGGFIAGLVNGLFRHHGGLVGSGGGMRQVPLSAFLGAQRFHEGGLPGLKPGEVGAVLKKGEEVITEDDPRHVGNGGGMGGGNTRVVNAIDAGSFLEEAMRSRAGERVILNFIRANPSAVRGALGV